MNWRPGTIGSWPQGSLLRWHLRFTQPGHLQVVVSSSEKEALRVTQDKEDCPTHIRSRAALSASRQAATCPQLPAETGQREACCFWAAAVPSPRGLKGRRGCLQFFHRGHRLSGLYCVWLVLRHFLFRTVSHSNPPCPRLRGD